MKVIKYKIQSGESLLDVSIGYNETSIEIAKAEAYNGEYTIEDDGVEEVIETTQMDIIEAQVAYTAIMTGTLLGE